MICGFDCIAVVQMLFLWWTSTMKRDTNKMSNNHCYWLSLRRLVSWINHWPCACCSTFWKSIFKHQLGCRFDILDSISSFFLYFDMCNHICLDTLNQSLALSLLLKYSLFFSSTPVLTSWNPLTKDQWCGKCLNIRVSSRHAQQQLTSSYSDSWSIITSLLTIYVSHKHTIMMVNETQDYVLLSWSFYKIRTTACNDTWIQYTDRCHQLIGGWLE